MSARSRAGSVKVGKAGCLYEPVFFALFGVFSRPCFFVPPFRLREIGMPWDFMGSNGNLWVNTGNILFQRPVGNSILWPEMLNLGGNRGFTAA